MSDKRDGRMNFGMFFKNTGHHIAAWLHPGSQSDAGINIQHYAECAKKCEAAGLDFIFFADSVNVRHAPVEILSQTSQYIAYFEPITLLSALSMATERIGLTATATTTYSEPYNIARMFASLDHLSQGRAGWNVVTSGSDASQNFGMDAEPVHDERYRRAHEFVDVVRGLWDSWDDDAFVYDRAAGRFFDPDKMRTLNHDGKYFKSKGPLNVPRAPQGYPVLFQAGISEAGRELSAAIGEGIFSASLTIEQSAEHYADIKKRMTRYGRRPDQMRVLPGCTVYCGRTEAEANEKEENLASLIRPDVGMGYISTILGMDLSDCTPDDQLPDQVGTRSEHGGYKNIMAIARQENLTIGQIYRRLAGSHGKLSMRGTPSQVADQMQAWYDDYACDGFILQPCTMPGDLDDLLELLIPELLNRGMMREGYEGTTLRDHLGLDRPPSRYAEERAAKAS